MSWFKFWKAGEQYADRLYTVSVTLTVLKVCDYLSLPWTPIFVCSGLAFVGGVLFGTIAAIVKPDEPQPRLHASYCGLNPHHDGKCAAVITRALGV